MINETMLDIVPHPDVKASDVELDPKILQYLKATAKRIRPKGVIPTWVATELSEMDIKKMTIQVLPIRDTKVGRQDSPDSDEVVIKLIFFVDDGKSPRNEIVKVQSTPKHFEREVNKQTRKMMKKLGIKLG
jgi:hypothetical protein